MSAPYDKFRLAVAARVALMGAPDEAVADIFGVDLATIAQWAWDHEEFFLAITPSDEEKAVWRAQHEAAAHKRRAGRRRRLAESPQRRIRNSVSARMWAALRGNTDGALFSRLGYGAADLVAHLEQQFTPGMSWKTYGKWHVDHRRPCASFDMTDPAQFGACWSLDNLQPLWATDNVRKGASYGGA